METPSVPNLNLFNATENRSESEHNSAKPLPSFDISNNVADNNSASQSISSQEQLATKEKSPEFQSKSFEKSINNDIITPDNEQIGEKAFTPKSSDFPALRTTRSNLRAATSDEQPKPRLREKKQSAAVLKRLSQDRWRLNPLQNLEEQNKNDVPLQHHERLHEDQYERMPYCLDSQDPDSDEFETLCEQMSAKLESLHQKYSADLMSSERKSSWGSPIKVGTSKQVSPYP